MTENSSLKNYTHAPQLYIPHHWVSRALVSWNLYSFIRVRRFFFAADRNGMWNSIPDSWSTNLRKHRPYNEHFDWRYAWAETLSLKNLLMPTVVYSASLSTSCIDRWEFIFVRMGSQALLCSTQRRPTRPRSDSDSQVSSFLSFESANMQNLNIRLLNVGCTLI